MSEPLIIGSEVELIDGKAPCPDCGKYYKVSADGSLRAHKCSGVHEVSASTGEARGRSRATTGRKSRKQAPDKVVKLGSDVIATGAEWLAANMIARAVDCKAKEVPADIEDSEKMVGPFINAIWPKVPAGGQKLIAEIADQEDLIYACMDWYFWFQGLQQWADNYLAAKHEESKQSTQPMMQAVPSEGVPNVNAQPASSPANGNGLGDLFGGITLATG